MVRCQELSGGMLNGRGPNMSLRNSIEFTCAISHSSESVGVPFRALKSFCDIVVQGWHDQQTGDPSSHSRATPFTMRFDTGFASPNTRVR